jgi:hypothetical protein
MDRFECKPALRQAQCASAIATLKSGFRMICMIGHEIFLVSRSVGVPVVVTRPALIASGLLLFTPRRMI